MGSGPETDLFIGDRLTDGLTDGWMVVKTDRQAGMQARTLLGEGKGGTQTAVRRTEGKRQADKSKEAARDAETDREEQIEV